jgi:hypothetical protein
MPSRNVSTLTEYSDNGPYNFACSQRASHSFQGHAKKLHNWHADFHNNNVLSEVTFLRTFSIDGKSPQEFNFR